MMSLTIQSDDATLADEWQAPPAESTTNLTGTAWSPRRMWGNPTIPGTRIPIFRLVELYRQGGHTPEDIALRIYRNRITADQVRMALGLRLISTAEVSG